MLKSSKLTATIAGAALASAFAVTGANAHQSYTGHSHSSYTTPSYGTTYTAPTVNLGPIEYVQPQSTVQYQYPTTTYTTPIVPSATTTYTAPVYSTPTYTTPTYTAPTYTAPSYTTPTYTTPYIARYDATDRIRSRLQRQRSRIHAALDRGDLREGERRKLRRKMRNIRHLFRDYRNNDGVISHWEEQELMRKLDRQSRRIARLANNHRTVFPGYSPYAPYPGHGYYR